MELSTPENYRRTVLDFCLAPLRVQLGEEAGGDVPTTLTISGQTLEVDAWEQSALRETLTPGSGAAKPWAALVTECIAFRLGAKLRIAAWVKKTSNSEALVTFAAAGIALAAELQHMIDLLIVAGQVGSAKKLTQCRHKIVSDVKALRRLLPDADSDRAERVAADLTGPLRHDLPVSTSIGDSPKGAGEYTPRAKHASDKFFDPRNVEDKASASAEAGRRRRVRGMSALLIGSTIVWLIFFMPRLFEPRVVVLQKPQFQHLPAVSGVTARPPSLYIEVQPQAWDALDPIDQRNLLDEIGRIAVGANYNGVQVKKEKTGAVVGRWLREQGTQLISGS